MSQRRLYSILLFLLMAYLWFCSGTNFSQEPVFSDDLARRLLDEAAEKAETAFAILPDSVHVIRADGQYATVELTLLWEPAIALADGKSVEFELLRLAIDYGSFVFSDERGNRWRSVTGGESNAVLLEHEFSKTFRIKLKRETDSTVRVEDDSSNEAAGDSSLRLSGSGRFSVLLGLAKTDFLFHDILAPVLEINPPETVVPESRSANYLARRTLDEAAVTVFSARRMDGGVRITLGVEYAEPFDFFDSHEERLFRRPMSLHRAERTRGASPDRPKSVRPLAMRPSGGTFELLFELPTGFQARDFSISLPVRIIEKEIVLPCPR